MKRMTDGFRMIGGDGAERWFAGANTEAGFRGSYGELADEDRLERLYVIKGGPGTGKSTLMKQAAGEAERAGCSVVRYLCGSDPESLDAVVFDGRIALADGTAPHPLEMRYPGASSSLVDLSRFWDERILSRESGEIRRLTEGKREAYREAYRYLSAAGRMEEELVSLAGACYDGDKAAAFAGRLVRRLRKEGKIGRNGVGALRRYSHAVTMRGLWQTDAVTVGTGEHYVIEDAMGIARLFMPRLAETLTEAGAEPVCGILPVGGGIAGIRAGNCSFAVGRAVEGEIPIRMTRFVRPGEGGRGRMRLTERIGAELMTAASDALSRAADCHFTLEEIYGSAMDYDRMAAYRREVTEQILDRLGGR